MSLGRDVKKNWKKIYERKIVVIESVVVHVMDPKVCLRKHYSTIKRIEPEKTKNVFRFIRRKQERLNPLRTGFSVKKNDNVLRIRKTRHTIVPAKPSCKPGGVSVCYRSIRLRRRRDPTGSSTRECTRTLRSYELWCLHPNRRKCVSGTSSQYEIGTSSDTERSALSTIKLRPSLEMDRFRSESFRIERKHITFRKQFFVFLKTCPNVTYALYTRGLFCFFSIPITPPKSVAVKNTDVPPDRYRRLTRLE